MLFTFRFRANRGVRSGQMPFWLGEQGRGWGLMISCTRATRGRGLVEDQSAPNPEERTSELEGEHLYRAMNSMIVFLIACLNGKQHKRFPGGFPSLSTSSSLFKP